MVNDERARHRVRIVDYSPHHHEHFRALNLAWITKYFVVEEADRKALDDPEHNILQSGGAILMAEADGRMWSFFRTRCSGRHSLSTARWALRRSRSRERTIGAQTSRRCSSCRAPMAPRIAEERSSLCGYSR